MYRIITEMVDDGEILTFYKVQMKYTYLGFFSYWKNIPSALFVSPEDAEKYIEDRINFKREIIKTYE